MSRKARKFKGFFRPKLGDLQKKKKVFAKIETDILSNFANSDVWGGLFLNGGGLFSIFHIKSTSKAQKTCNFAYFTSQWGGLGPPPPSPWLCYCPQPIQNALILEQLCIINLILNKDRLNKGHYKTLHKSGICLLP